MHCISPSNCQTANSWQCLLDARRSPMPWCKGRAGGVGGDSATRASTQHRDRVPRTKPIGRSLRRCCMPQRRPDRPRNPKLVHQRLRAVVPCAHRNAQPVEQFAQVKGCTPSTRKTPPLLKAPCRRSAARLCPPIGHGRWVNTCSWAVKAGIPTPFIQSKAAPKAMPPLMCGVPASNLGSSLQVALFKADGTNHFHRRGTGMASSNASLPYKMPMPVGP